MAKSRRKTDSWFYMVQLNLSLTGGISSMTWFDEVEKALKRDRMADIQICE